MRIHGTSLWGQVVAESFVLRGAVYLFSNAVVVFSSIVAVKVPIIIAFIGNLVAIIMMLAVSITIMSIAVSSSMKILIFIIKLVIIKMVCFALNYVLDIVINIFSGH